MTSPASSGPDGGEPVAGQPEGRSSLTGALAAAARALAEAPADADDAAVLAILSRTVIPALGDVVALEATPGGASRTPRLGDRGGRPSEVVAPLGGEAAGNDLLVFRSDDPGRRYDDADRAVVVALAAMVGMRRVVHRQETREATLRQQLAEMAQSGRELVHLLNNDLTMPVGVVELLRDRNSAAPDLQEMLQAAAHDLAALERHVRAFHDRMREQFSSTGTS